MAEDAPYCVEAAKSDRSTCVVSKEKIAKGELRFGSLVLMGGRGSYKWRKLAFITAVQVANVEKVVGGVEKVLGFESLTIEGQDEVVKAFTAAALATPKPKPKAKPKAKKVQDMKNEMGASSDDISQAHHLIDLAKNGCWSDVYKVLDTRKELVNLRPDVREYSTLHQAAFLGNCEAAATLIDRYNADPRQLTKHGLSAVDIAKERGHTKLAEIVAERFAIVSQHLASSTPPRTQTEESSLSSDTIAAAHKLIDFARDADWEHVYMLLDENIDLVNIRPEVREYSVLHQAVYHGDGEAVTVLIDKYGANPKQRTKRGKLAVDVAIECGHHSLVELLAPCAKGKDDDTKLDAAHDAPKMMQANKAMSPLVTSVAGCKTTSSAKDWPLSSPIKKQKTSAPRSITPTPALTPAVVSAAHGLIDLAKSANWEGVYDVLDKQVELVNLRPEVREYSVIHQAAYYGREDAVMTLVKKYGADLEQKTRSGISAYQVALEQGHKNVTLCISKFREESSCGLLELTPEKPSKFFSILGGAKSADGCQKTEASQVLKEGPFCIASIPPPTNDVIAAAHKLIDIAYLGHWDELYKALDVKPDLVNVRPDVRQFAVIHQAAFQGAEEVVMRLIDKYGADPEQRTKKGLTATEVAADQGHTALSEAIKSRLNTVMAESRGDDDYDMVQMPDGSWKVMCKHAAASLPAPKSQTDPIGKGVTDPVKNLAKLVEPAASLDSKSQEITRAEPTYVPMDMHFPEASAWHVHQTSNATWECILTLKTFGSTAEKFQILQLAKHNLGNQFCIWSRSGRTGTDGANEILRFADVDAAMADFKSKFYEKTNNKWENRNEFKPFFGKWRYTLPRTPAA